MGETLPIERTTDETRKDFCVLWKEAEEAVARERRAAKGDLYFVQAGRAVKIGRTVNLVNRLGKMQADNHEELNCLLCLRGRGHEEDEWHERFDRYRIRGEWFKLTPTIKAAIERERWFVGSPLYEPLGPR